MPTHYSPLFQAFESSFKQANRLFPHVLKNELQQLVHALPVDAFRQVLSVTFDDSAHAFFASKTRIDCYSVAADLPDNHYDCIVCHHTLRFVSEQGELISQLLQALKPNGYLCIAEIAPNSKEFYFLKDFVTKYQPLQQTAHYLSQRLLRQVSQQHANVQLLRSEYCPVAWEAESIPDLVTFARVLFGLNMLDDQITFKHLQQYFHLQYNKHFGATMDWNMLYITFHKS